LHRGAAAAHDDKDSLDVNRLRPGTAAKARRSLANGEFLRLADGERVPLRLHVQDGIPARPLEADSLGLHDGRQHQQAEDQNDPEERSFIVIPRVMSRHYPHLLHTM